jgi:uncharacterized damage-inducible protein DinB
MEHMVRVDHVLDSWKTVREDTAQAVEDFAGRDAEFRAAPEMATFREIARHILDASHGLTGMMLAGVDDFATADFREKLMQYKPALPEPPDAAALAAALRGAAAERIEELRRRPPEFFAHVMTRFDGQRVTRLEMLQMVKEHELTHRAQLFVYLRLNGIVPATTRRRQARPPQK